MESDLSPSRNDPWVWFPVLWDAIQAGKTIVLFTEELDADDIKKKLDKKQ